MEPLLRRNKKRIGDDVIPRSRITIVFPDFSLKKKAFEEKKRVYCETGLIVLDFLDSGYETKNGKFMKKRSQSQKLFTYF